MAGAAYFTLAIQDFVLNANLGKTAIQDDDMVQRVILWGSTEV
ncbi:MULTISPECIES: hypothetical protein [Sulfitobacter]|nr:MULTISPECIES: hypothetical protein [Sulfitobacter]MCZ4259131.1 hypothetical protein [Sulfitobacter sp. G21635-S1]